MPDTVSLINISDTLHLERLVWAMYDGALLVGSQTELPGDHSGALCWQVSSNTSTGAAMMWPTAHLTHKHCGITSRGRGTLQRAKTRCSMVQPSEYTQSQEEKIEEQLQAPLQDAKSYGLEWVLLLLPTQHAARAPQYGGTLFPNPEHHALHLI